jgi:NAD(P)-dependent dehydrogenase (short-subunit alcohol dehydrogenase family)
MVVLGGGAGIGRQTVHALVQAGADVAAAPAAPYSTTAIAAVVH